MKTKHLFSIVAIGFVISVLTISCNTNTSVTKNNPTNTEPADIKEITIPKYIPANQALHDTIVALDKLYWQAYNKGDSTTLFNLMADDHEFYHDIGGPTFSKEKMKPSHDELAATALLIKKYL